MNSAELMNNASQRIMSKLGFSELVKAAHRRNEAWILWRIAEHDKDNFIKLKKD